MPPLYDRNAQSEALLLDADDLLSIGSGFPQDALLLPNDADQHFAVPLPLALDGTHFVEGDDDDNLSLGAVEEGYNTNTMEEGYNRSSPERYDYDDSIIDGYSTSSDSSGDAEKPSRPNRLRRPALVLIAFLAVVAALLAPAVLSYRNNTQRLQKQNEISTLRQLIVDEFNRHDNDGADAADGTDTTKSKLHVLFNGGFERVWNELSVEQQYDWLDVVQYARRDVEEKEKKRQERRRERQRRREEEKKQAQSKGDKVVTSKEHLNRHKKKKRKAKEV